MTELSSKFRRARLPLILALGALMTLGGGNLPGALGSPNPASTSGAPETLRALRDLAFLDLNVVVDSKSIWVVAKIKPDYRWEWRVSSYKGKTVRPVDHVAGYMRVTASFPRPSPHWPTTYVFPAAPMPPVWSVPPALPNSIEGLMDFALDDQRFNDPFEDGGYAFFPLTADGTVKDRPWPTIAFAAGDTRKLMSGLKYAAANPALFDAAGANSNCAELTRLMESPNKFVAISALHTVAWALAVRLTPLYSPPSTSSSPQSTDTAKAASAYEGAIEDGIASQRGECQSAMVYFLLTAYYPGFGSGFFPFSTDSASEILIGVINQAQVASDIGGLANAIDLDGSGGDADFLRQACEKRFPKAFHFNSQP